MLDAGYVIDILNDGFFAGVPDSQLKPLCDCLMDRYGINPSHHVIAANEGNAVALAAGYHLATGKTPVVYLQNSGIGNIINPVASLLDERVYGIPCIFIVGWRGEPGVHDEPQHVFQGMVTTTLLEDMDIECLTLGANTTQDELIKRMESWKPRLSSGKSVALIVRKGALSYEGKTKYRNDNSLIREDVIRHITDISGEDVIVSTTGKTSRELFEIREHKGQSHKYDFLTVGSMGHSSSIALGIALNKPNTRVWCVDGDGAALMHMGAMALIGACKPANLIHVIINNAAHESVGGMPTVAGSIDFAALAKACGYPNALSAANEAELLEALRQAKESSELSLIEVKAAISARKDLGRPTSSAMDNKCEFLDYCREKRKE